MNGELAQLVCLASYGTAWLAGDGTADPPDLQHQNSTFRFVGTLEFVDPGTGPTLTTVRDWLLLLRSRGTRRLWLVIADPKPRPAAWGPVDEHLMVAFVNTGAWTLLATSDTDATMWRRTWVPGHPDAPDRRVWGVRYDAQPVAAEVPTPTSVEQASRALTEVMTRARVFSAREDMDRWVKHFDGVLAGDDRDLEFSDMLSPAYPPAAQRLARSANGAWVFGGMGSWNDEGFADEQVNATYQDISRTLYLAVLQALVASADCPLAGPVAEASGG